MSSSSTSPIAAAILPGLDPGAIWISDAANLFVSFRMTVDRVRWHLLRQGWLIAPPVSPIATCAWRAAQIGMFFATAVVPVLATLVR